MTDDRGQVTEVRGRMTEDREIGIRKAELYEVRNAEVGIIGIRKKGIYNKDRAHRS